jgi:hypothetical protein
VSHSPLNVSLPRERSFEIVTEEPRPARHGDTIREVTPSRLTLERRFTRPDLQKDIAEEQADSLRLLTAALALAQRASADCRPPAAAYSGRLPFVGLRAAPRHPFGGPFVTRSAISFVG